MAESVAKTAPSVEETRLTVSTRADALTTATQVPSTITMVQEETMTVPLEQPQSSRTRAAALGLGSSEKNAVWRDIPISGSDA